MRVCIIGAGPAGLTAAYQISKHIGNGVTELHVIEASEEVGGLSRSIELWGRVLDIGPHRFYTRDKVVFKFWKQFAEKTNTINRLTRIYFKGQFINYPIKLLQIFNFFGPLNSFKIVLSYLNSRLFISKIKADENLENWLIKSFGRKLYNLFFKEYSEKLWGLPCNEIDNKFAKQRIKGISFIELITNSIKLDNKKAKSLIDSFEYPEKGNGIVYNNLSKRIIDNGGKIFLSEAVIKIESNPSNNLVFVTSNKRTIKVNHLISTMPLNYVIKSLARGNERLQNLSNQLKFRNSILIYLKINKSFIFKDQWIYIQDKGFNIGRITNFNNWQPNIANEQTTILCAEFWCNKTDQIWAASEDKIFQNCSKEIIKLQLAKAEEIEDFKVLKIPNSYPVYFCGFDEVMKDIKRFIKQFEHISIIGRYGAYKYNNQDHSILMGLLAAANLLNNENHDLWEVNSDYQKYFEA